MEPSSRKSSFFRILRRAWAVIDRADRLRLKLLAVYGIAISALDTIALLLIFAVIALLDNQSTSGISASLIHALSLGGKNHYRTALVLFAITAVLFVVRSSLSVFGLWLTVGATNTAQVNLVARLLVGHARAPQLVRLERDTSETLRTVINSVAQVTFGVVGSSVNLIANIAVGLAVALGLFLSSPLVALVVVVYFTAITLAWVLLVRGGLQRRGRRVQKLQQEQFQLVMQALAAAKELQLRGRSLFFSDNAVARTRGIASSSRGLNVLNGSLRYLLETSLVLGAVMIVGAAGLTAGRSAVLPAVGLVLAGAFRLLPALNQILFLSNQVEYNRSAIDLVEREIATFGRFAEQPATSEPAATPLRFTKELRLEGVTFRYPSRTQPALSDVSLAVRPGEAIGILGPIGSGKSTLLDVVLGLLEPDAGRVTVDGVLLADCRDGWQRSIGYVPQEVYLVDDTLRANVAFGWSGDEIDEDAVLEAIRLARLTDVVAGLPEGLETIVGERGVNLSGGQRQLVGLARALYVRPSVLVLDEATSNLDQGTERRIVETLAELGRAITVIIVTHRVSSVSRCDRIVYLEAGVIQAQGTLDEVQISVSGLHSLTTSVASVT